MQRKRRRPVREPILSDDEDDDVSPRPAKRRKVCRGDIRSYMPIRDDLADMKKLRPSKEENERILKQTQITAYMTPRPREVSPLDESKLEEGPTCSICLEPCDLFTTTNGCTCPHHFDCLVELSQYVEDAGNIHGKQPKCPKCRRTFHVVRRRDGTSVKETIVAPEPTHHTSRLTVVTPTDGVWVRGRPPPFFAATRGPGSIFDLASVLTSDFSGAMSALRSGVGVLERRVPPRRRRSTFLPLVREKLVHIGWSEEECVKVAERFDEVYTNVVDDDIASRKLLLLASLREDTDMHLDRMLEVAL